MLRSTERGILFAPLPGRNVSMISDGTFKNWVPSPLQPMFYDVIFGSTKVYTFQRNGSNKHFSNISMFLSKLQTITCVLLPNKFNFYDNDASHFFSIFYLVKENKITFKCHSYAPSSVHAVCSLCAKDCIVHSHTRRTRT